MCIFVVRLKAITYWRDFVAIYLISALWLSTLSLASISIHFKDLIFSCSSTLQSFHIIIWDHLKFAAAVFLIWPSSLSNYERYKQSKTKSIFIDCAPNRDIYQALLLVLLSSKLLYNFSTTTTTEQWWWNWWWHSESQTMLPLASRFSYQLLWLQQ